MGYRKTYSIYQRHFFLTAGMILFSFILLSASFMTLTYRYAVEETKGMLRERASYIATISSYELKRAGDVEGKHGKGRKTMDKEVNASQSEVLICQKNGQILAQYGDADRVEDLLGKSISEEVCRTLQTEEAFNGHSDLSVYTKPRFVVGVPIRETMDETDGEIMGYVFVTASTANLTRMWRSFAVLFLTSATAVLIIACISSFITTRQQVRPLRELTDTINRFGMGEYDLRVRDCGDFDEVSRLGTAFNTMADSIASAEQRRQEFVANISHELKTPMTTISGFTDGILDGTIPPERQRESLQVISEETRRLSRLVRRMLDMSQLDAREQTVLCQSQFNITETFAQVLISLERKITSRGLDVDAQFPDNDVMVWGDPDSITQVCYNLLDNAIKFATPGTAIGVSIVPRGTKAWITVRNMGETIPPEELGMIFDRFHKSDRSRSLDKEGVGLGLYIVKTILNSHKENITVTSQDGVTEFRFSLTLAE